MATKVKVTKASTSGKITVTEGMLQELFDHWIAKGLIQHRVFDAKMKRKVKSVLSEYPLDAVKKCVDTYARMLYSSDYKLTYKWRIEEFMQRGFRRFLDESEPERKYRGESDPLLAVSLTPPDGTADSPRYRAEQYMNASHEERIALRKKWSKEKGGENETNDGSKD